MVETLRSRRLWLIAALAAALCIPAGATSATVPALFTDAAVIDLAVPSVDPCVVYDVRAEAVRFVYPDEPSQLVYSIGVFNSCTGEFLDSIVPLTAPLPIDDSAFTVAPANTSADLNVTVPGFDPFDQSTAPLTINLHWSAPQGSSLPDGLAVVTGTLTRGSLVIVLDNSITWNRWGSDTFPWAGLWLCRSAAIVKNPGGGGPHLGCLGQS
jgi:hypothetical protein